MKKRAFSIATDGSIDIGAVKLYPVAVVMFMISGSHIII